VTADSNPARAIGRRLWTILERNRRAIRDALVIAGVARAVWYYVVQGIHPWEFVGVDARAYWRVDLAHPYASSAVGEPSTYLYPPVFAQVLAPLSVLPFPVFFALWTALLVALLVWLVRPWPWALAILVLPISYELFVGNIHLLIAAVIARGFMRPGLWAFPLLSKVTPGVGVVWFAVRREWHSLAVALGVTVLAVTLSVLLSPNAWAEWLAFVIADRGKGEALPLRLAVAFLLVAFAGLTDRRWLVPVGVWIAFPVVWVETWVVLLAIIRIRSDAPSRPQVETMP
jgi:Glycosyltransferase family 87